MSSSIVISIPSQSGLHAFCSTNNVSPVSIAKLAFATVLHQYFDVSKFTCVEGRSNDCDDHTLYPITRRQQIKYDSGLASTATIRAALHVRETDLPSDDNVTPLLIEDAATGDTLVTKNLNAGLVFVKRVTSAIEASSSSSAAALVSDLRKSSHSCAFLT
jgi:hypothetical protein